MRSFLELPLEIVRAILEAVVLSRGLKRAMRLRIVCKIFAVEITEAIYSTRMLEDSKLSWEECPLARSYAEYRLLQRQTEGLPELNALQKIATILSTKKHKIRPRKPMPSYSDVVSGMLNMASIFGQGREHLLLERQRQLNDTEFRYNLLVAATYFNNLSMVKRMLRKEKLCVGGRTRLFSSPPAAAVIAGSLDVLIFLFKGSTNFDTVVHGALMLASRGGHVEMVKFLLNADWVRRELSKPAPGDSLSVTLSMATPSPEIFHMVAKFRQDLAMPPLTSKELAKILSQVAEFGWEQMLHYLLSPGVLTDFDKCLDDAIKSAVKRGSTDMVKLLLDHGAEPGRYELEVAAGSGHYAILQMMLEHIGPQQLCSSVACAAHGRSLRITQMLLDYEVDINLHRGSQPAVVTAIEREDAALFRFLVENGADYQTPLTGGKAFEKAREENLESMLALLREYGIDERLVW